MKPLLVDNNLNLKNYNINNLFSRSILIDIIASKSLLKKYCKNNMIYLKGVSQLNL